MKKNIIIAIAFVILCGGGTFLYINHSKNKNNELISHIEDIKTSIIIPDNSDYNEDEKYAQDEIIKTIDEYSDLKNIDELEKVQERLDTLNNNVMNRINAATVKARADVCQIQYSTMKDDFINNPRYDLNTEVGQQYLLPLVETEYNEIIQMFDDCVSMEDINLKVEAFNILAFEKKYEACENNDLFYKDEYNENGNGFCYFG